MKQFQVPQFITVEDKVIGPLTIKQAVYLLGGGIIIILARLVLLPIFFYPVAFIIAALAAALAFYKMNDVPFPTVIKNGFFYSMRPHVYIWKKEPSQPSSTPQQAKTDVRVSATPKLSESKLSDLAWSLNIKEKFRNPEEENDTPKQQF